MKRNRILCVLMTTALLTGCADVPEEVRKEINNYHSECSSQNIENNGFAYISTSDIEQDFEKAIKQDYGQFHISNQIRPNTPNELYLMSLAKTEHFSVNYDQAMSLFFTESELNIRETVKDNDGNILFDDPVSKVYGCVGDDGFIAMLKPEVYDISFAYNEPNVRIYHPARNEDLSDEYELEDGECSIRDAVNYVNRWLISSYQVLSPNYSYEVETVIVREHNGKYLFEILIRVLYKDVALNSYTQELDIKNGSFTKLLKYTNCGLQIQMVKSDEIASFTNLCGIFEPEETDTVEQCISLQSALEYCAATFTDFKDVTISDIQAMYTIEPQYVETEPDVFILTGYQSRPVWEFVIDVDPPEFMKSGEVNTYGDIRKYIYVDMITGELHYNFDIVYRQ